MLNDMVKASANPEAAKVKEEIDAVRKKRSDVIIQVKRRRRQLNYKEAEGAAITKLIDIEKKKAEGQEKGKNNKIGYLKKLKNKLEFKIATEASSLSAEKDLVRKIDEINSQLKEAYKGIRLERKREFINGDIEQHRVALLELDKQIVESDKKLDELYDKLRKLLGIEGGREKKKMQQPQKRRPQQMQSQEINLEDIVVIKKKEKKVEEE